MKAQLSAHVPAHSPVIPSPEGRARPIPTKMRRIDTTTGTKNRGAIFDRRFIPASTSSDASRSRTLPYSW